MFSPYKYYRILLLLLSLLFFYTAKASLPTYDILALVEQKQKNNHKKVEAAFAAMETVREAGAYVDALSDLFDGGIITLPVGIRKGEFELIIREVSYNKETDKNRVLASCAFLFKENGQRMAFEGYVDVEGQMGMAGDPVNSGSCIMEPDFDDSGSVEDVFRVIPNLQDGGVNPFKTTGEMIFKLQLVDPANESLRFCTREFSIPGKPDSVGVSQQDASRTLNGSNYHLLSMVRPYAVLDIIDTYEFAHLRKPYKIFRGNSLIQEVAWDLLQSYAELSPEEQYGVYQSFLEDYYKQFLHGSMFNHRQSPFGRYFDTQFSIWAPHNKGFILYEGDYEEPGRTYNMPSINKQIKLLSSNKQFYVFGDFEDHALKAFAEQFRTGFTGTYSNSFNGEGTIANIINLRLTGGYSLKKRHNFNVSLAMINNQAQRGHSTHYSANFSYSYIFDLKLLRSNKKFGFEGNF